MKGIDRFEQQYPEPYELAKNIARKYISAGMRILDIGSGDAPIATFLNSMVPNLVFTCVDSSPHNVLGENFQFINKDFNEYVEEIDCQSFDFILLNTALHEIWDGDKASYLNHLLNHVKRVIRVNGFAYIGDYRYSATAKDEEFQDYRRYLLSTINHADDMDRFYQSDEILCAVCCDTDFRLCSYEEIRVTEMIERYYYGIVVKRNKNTQTKNWRSNGPTYFL